MASYDLTTSLTGVADVGRALGAHGYLADDGLAHAVYLALRMRRPLLLEGEVGVGKTSLAKALAAARGADLIRLQCYEGIDASQALYEWDYARQLLALRAGGGDGPDAARELYREEFLSPRPLLRALRSGEQAVLLIDELDRADDQFEAFLLEILADFTISIPELGTIASSEPPVVVITSNRTRELHDALKRRCLFHWMTHPPRDQVVAIIRSNAPEVGEPLAEAVAAAVERLRELGLVKPPGPAEAIDWARAVATLGEERLTGPMARVTLGWVAKNREDLERVAERLVDVVEP